MAEASHSLRASVAILPTVTVAELVAQLVYWLERLTPNRADRRDLIVRELLSAFAHDDRLVTSESVAEIQHVAHRASRHLFLVHEPSADVEVDTISRGGQALTRPPFNEAPAGCSRFVASTVSPSCHWRASKPFGIRNHFCSQRWLTQLGQTDLSSICEATAEAIRQ